MEIASIYDYIVGEDDKVYKVWDIIDGKLFVKMITFDIMKDDPKFGAVFNFKGNYKILI